MKETVIDRRFDKWITKQKPKTKQKAAAVTNIILNDDYGYWEQMNQIVELFQPIYGVLRLVDSDRPVLSKVYPEMQKLEKLVNGLAETHSLWTRDRVQSLTNLLQLRFSKMFNDLHYTQSSFKCYVLILMKFSRASYPILSQLASRINRNTASASSAEHNWSTFDQKLPKRRSRPSSTLSNDSVTVTINFPLLQQEPRRITMNRLVVILTRSTQEIMFNEEQIFSLLIIDDEVIRLDELVLALIPNDEVVEGEVLVEDKIDDRKELKDQWIYSVGSLI
ncbi:hypothetical protein P9112_010465 [Eukaryota sp. TZLM1-RC]